MNKVKLYVIEALAKRLPPCDVIVHQLSDSMDHKLTIRERIRVRVHLWVCVWCTAYGEQIKFISKAMRHWRDNTEKVPVPEGRLSTAAAERIKRAMRDYES